MSFERSSKIVNARGNSFMSTLCGCPSTGHIKSCSLRDDYNKAAYNSAAFDNTYLGEWRPPYASHDEAYIPEREMMVARVLDMVRNSGIAAGAVHLWTDHLVGSFTPDPMPHYECLGWDEDSAMEWCSTVLDFMEKYLLNDAYIDASGECNFLELLRLAARMEFIYGEVTATVEWIPKSESTGPLQTVFNFIDPGLVRTPTEYVGQVEEGDLKRVVVDGFLKDKRGRKHGAYIYKNLCDDWGAEGDEDYTFVPMKGRNETAHRELLIHIFDKELPHQTRGVSKFAPILEGMKMDKQLKREILLAAQGRNKIMGFLKSTRDVSSTSRDFGMNQAFAPSFGSDGSPMPNDFNPISPVGGQGGLQYDDEKGRYEGLSPDAKLAAKIRLHHQVMDTSGTADGVRFVQGWPGEDIEVFQPNNASLGTTALSNQIAQDQSAGTSIPKNMLLMDNSGGTYSGLRTGRLDFFQAIKSAKPRMDELANCILRHAMDEAIAKGLVKFPRKIRALIKRQGLKPHEYYAQNIPMIMATRWLGPPEKLIDPNKEIMGYRNGELYDYLDPSDIVGRLNGISYHQFLAKNNRSKKLKIAAQVSCDDYEARKRIEANNKLIEEGLIPDPNKPEPDQPDNNDTASPQISNEESNEESSETITSEIPQSEPISARNDQIIENAPKFNTNNNQDSINSDRPNSGILGISHPDSILINKNNLDAKSPPMDVDMFAEAVLEKLEPSLINILQGLKSSGSEE